MNARGIPTAAYQVLHLLSCRGGYPLLGDTPCQGVLHLVPCQGVLHLGVSPPSDLAGVTPFGPGWGMPPPQLDLAGVLPWPSQTDGWTDTCQNIAFPRTTYAVGKYLASYLHRILQKYFNTWRNYYHLVINRIWILFVRWSLFCA